MSGYNQREIAQARACGYTEGYESARHRYRVDAPTERAAATGCTGTDPDEDDRCPECLIARACGCDCHGGPAECCGEDGDRVYMDIDDGRVTGFFVLAADGMLDDVADLRDLGCTSLDAVQEGAR